MTYNPLHRISVRYLSEYDSMTNPNPRCELVFWRAYTPYTHSYTVSLSRIDQLIDHWYTKAESCPTVTFDSFGGGLRINLNDRPTYPHIADY